MPRSRRRLRPAVPGLALVMAAVMALTACGSEGRTWSDSNGSAGAHIRFAVSLQPDETRVVSELVKKFEARSGTGGSVELFTRFRDPSGVKVTVESVGPGGMTDFLKAEGSNVHLFAQDNGALADLVHDKLVQDIPDVIVAEGVVASMPPSSTAPQRFLPFRPNVRLTYANKKDFEDAKVAPPGDVHQLEDVARQLRDADDDGRARVTLSLSHEDGGSPAAVTISELVLAFGGDPRRLDDKGFIAAFGFLQRLFKDGLLARESLSAKHDTEPDYLKAGTVSLAQNWSVTSAILESAGRLGEFQVHAGWQRRHVVGGDVLGIPTGVSGKEREAAVALANFLMSKEAQAFLVQKNAWPAIHQDAYEGRESDTIAAVKEALKNGWYRPPEMYWAAVVDAMNEAVDRIVFRREPSETVLRELHADVARNNPDYPAGG